MPVHRTRPIRGPVGFTGLVVGYTEVEMVEDAPAVVLAPINSRWASVAKMSTDGLVCMGRPECERGDE